MSGTVSRAEWRWAAAVALAVMVLSALPYAAGYLAQTPDLRFVGAVFNLQDYHSYLARMWQGYRGAWRFQILLTPEAHEGVFLQPFHIALGHLARLLGLGMPLTYQLARLVLGFFMLLTVYRFIAAFVSPLRTRRVAFLLTATSSGLGWLVEALHPTPPGGISPIDFWLIDANTFFSLFITTHFSAAILLLLCLFLLLLRTAEEPGAAFPWKESAWAVLLSWTLGLIHPYILLVADLIPALYLGWQVIAMRRLPKRLLIVLVAMGVAQAPLLGYDFFVFSTSPIFGAWAAQNITASPPPLYYLLGYGLVALLAAWGVRPALRASPRTWFLLLWMAAVFVLAYLPWGLQRRFVEGVHIALCILAAYGLVDGLMPALSPLLERLGCALRADSQRLRWLIQASLLVLAAVSNLYLLSTYTLAAATRHPLLFHTANEVAAVEWLAAHSAWDDTVLAAFHSGNWIAGSIGHRVVLGHGSETVDFAAKQAQVSAFFSGDASEAERRALLEEWGVRYVYVGPEERSLGAANPPLPGLRLLFQRDDVAIYRVGE